MGILLDTSALVDLQRRGNSLRDAIPTEVTEIFMPAIVLGELWIGIELAPSRKVKAARLSELRRLVEGTTVIPFSEELAPVYARIYAQLRSAGKLIPANDLAVACTAVHYDHVVLVGRNDEKHFRSVPSLQILTL